MYTEVKDSMKKFFEFLREHALKIYIFGKKKMKLLIYEWKKSNENAKICYICIEKCEDKHAQDKKNLLKLATIVIIQGDI